MGDLTLGKKHFRFFVSLYLLTLFTAGCVIFPLPAKKAVRGHVIDERSNELVPGTTTKEEILELFGRPTANWERKNTFIYYWETSNSEIHIALIAPVEAHDSSRSWTRRACFIKFDEQDLLNDIKIIERPKINQIGQLLINL